MTRKLRPREGGYNRHLYITGTYIYIGEFWMIRKLGPREGVIFDLDDIG